QPHGPGGLRTASSASRRPELADVDLADPLRTAREDLACGPRRVVVVHLERVAGRDAVVVAQDLPARFERAARMPGVEPVLQHLLDAAHHPRVRVAPRLPTLLNRRLGVAFGSDERLDAGEGELWGAHAS